MFFAAIIRLSKLIFKHFWKFWEISRYHAISLFNLLLAILHTVGLCLLNALEHRL